MPRLRVIAVAGRRTTATELASNASLCRIQVHQGRVRAGKVPNHAKREPAGLAVLAAIASIVTRNHLPGHTMATALTDGYVAGRWPAPSSSPLARASRWSRSTPAQRCRGGRRGPLSRQPDRQITQAHNGVIGAPSAIAWQERHTRRVGDQDARALEHQSRCLMIAGRGYRARSAFWAAARSKLGRLTAMQLGWICVAPRVHVAASGRCGG